MTETQNENVCDCCGSFHHRHIGIKRKWKLQQCSSCGLIFVRPQPERAYLATIYKKTAGYFATAEIDLSKTSANGALNLHEMLLANGVEVGTFLDVGCSTGKLIYHMNKLGWQVTGVDLNPDAIAVARQNHLNAFEGELEKIPFQEGSFDVIHMGDVIEHVRSPRRVLLTAHRLLRKNGLVIIKTPNAKCGFAISSLFLTKCFHFPWPHSEAPYHLYEFSPQTLSQLLSNTRFEIMRINASGHLSFSYIMGASGFFDTLKENMKQGGKYRFKWQTLTNIPKLLMVAGIVFPFYVLGRLSDILLSKGFQVTVVARKPL